MLTQALKAFDRKTVLAYNGVRRPTNPSDIWAKEVTLFEALISEDGELRDGPPGRFYPTWLSG
jgi:hypothetical protein